MTDYVAGKYEGIVDPAAEAFWLKCGMDPKMAKEFVGAKVCRFLFSDMGILWFQCNSQKMAASPPFLLAPAPHGNFQLD